MKIFRSFRNELVCTITRSCYLFSELLKRRLTVSKTFFDFNGLPSSSCCLGELEDREMVVELGEVRITSVIALSKYVMLTPSKHDDVDEQVDIEAKELICKTRPVAFCTHIGDNYYVSVKDDWNLVDLRRYYVPYGLSSEHVHPTRSGLSHRLDEWAHLVQLMPTIHEQHPELA